MRTSNPKEVRIIRRYSESLKLKVVEEVSEGRLTAKEAMSHYSICGRRTVDRWLRTYGKRSYETKILEVMMKSEYEEIQALKSALADSELRNRFMAAKLKAYERMVPEIKKKLTGKELKQFEENQKRLEESLSRSSAR